MKTREEHIEFIGLNLVAVAACAWSGFMGKGRGLVCVMSDQHDEDKRMVPYDFMAAQDVAKIITRWDGSKEARMVAEYDPQSEVVIGFLRTSENRLDFDSYRLQSNPPPRSRGRVVVLNSFLNHGKRHSDTSFIVNGENIEPLFIGNPFFYQNRLSAPP